jgi:tripartite-type tricarboxylate transporter receptor subunit TctC
VPGYSTLGWYSVVAPAGTPEAVLTKASAEVAKAVKEPQFGEQLKGLGLGSRRQLALQSSMHSAANSASK